RLLPRTLLAAALLALLAGTAAGDSTVRVAAKQSLPTFVLTGRGWGHGVGMPQYGALGYAVHGYSYKRILAHFYPGTALARTRVGQVRVLLADGARALVVSSQADFRVRDAGGTSYKLGPGSYALGPPLRLRVEPP